MNFQISHFHKIPVENNGMSELDNDLNDKIIMEKNNNSSNDHSPLGQISYSMSSKTRKQKLELSEIKTFGDITPLSL